MQLSRYFKILVATGLVVFTFACDNSSKKDKVSKDKTADTVTTNKPPADDPLGAEIPKAKQKCFTNEGLTHLTLITLNYTSATELTGVVASFEHETDKPQKTKFTGTLTGDKLAVRFDGTPPVVGAGSEWINKPWTLTNKDGTEKMLVIFNAKNYDTNKWQETAYEFVARSCE